MTVAAIVSPIETTRYGRISGLKAARDAFGASATGGVDSHGGHGRMSMVEIPSDTRCRTVRTGLDPERP